MKHTKPLLILLTTGLLSVGTVGLVLGDDDEHGEHARHAHHDGHRRDGGWLASRVDVEPVNNATYGKECGSCHMAYQPGLLPADAWTAVMKPDALAAHYGDDATLTDALRQEIATYLADNAADRSSDRRAKSFAAGYADTSANDLPRITESRYFVRKHDEIPDRLVTQNPKVGSFSQCNNCHRGAAEGVFNEHQVDIPGYGPWED